MIYGMIPYHTMQHDFLKLFYWIYFICLIWLYMSHDNMIIIFTKTIILHCNMMYDMIAC